MFDERLLNPKREKITEVYICVLDETYDVDCGTYKQEAEERQKFVELISNEFRSDFVEVNIGPGADLPAFLTLLSEHYLVSVIGTVLAVFLSGKPIVDNLEAWPKLAAKIKKFFTRNVYLNRNGAAVIAIDAIFEHMHGIPKSIKLLGYRSAPYADSALLSNLTLLAEISNSVETLYIGATNHIFDIEADGVPFRVSVDGKNVMIYNRQS